MYAGTKNILLCVLGVILYIYFRITLFKLQIRRKKQQQNQELYEKAISTIPSSTPLTYSHSTDVRTNTAKLKEEKNVVPNFVLGERVEDDVPNQCKISGKQESNAISSFFPLSRNNSNENQYDPNEVNDKYQENAKVLEETYLVEEVSSGRVLETINGENVFIPTLNFESVCSTTECSGDNFNKNANLLQGNFYRQA